MSSEMQLAEENGLGEKLDKLLTLIPPDGASKGNIALLKESGLSEDEYWLLRNKLIEQGKIGKGRGKGGSVYRLTIDKSVEKQSKKRQRKSPESDLYSDFEKWLNDFWTKDANLTWFKVERTAHQGSSKKVRGKWTRPDFAVVAVNTYRYFPGKFLEVVSFEVKPNLQEALAGVF